MVWITEDSVHKVKTMFLDMVTEVEINGLLMLSKLD